MEQFHDPVRHLHYLRQSLSQDKKPIGFFLSAGCPLAIEMEEGKWPLIPDVLKLTNILKENLKENKDFTTLLTEVVTAEKNENNIEDILSFLRAMLHVSKGGTVRGLSELSLQNLEIEICKNIVDTINVVLPTNNTPYHKLSKWISSIDREIPIELFTTNYDMLMEQALEEYEVPYFDGFVGARRSFFDLRAVEDNFIPQHWTRFWKIHGSINWYQDCTGDQKKIYRSSEVLDDASHLIYPSHLKYEESRKMPYLALIDQLSRFLRKKSSFLIISGYSFNDEHLNDTIINALKSNPTAMVLGLQYGSFNDSIQNGELTERYPMAYKYARRQHNLNIWTFNKAIIGTKEGNWRVAKETEDQNILHFISEVAMPSGGTQCNLKLGDFSILSNFLEVLIGLEKDENVIKY